MKDLRDSMREVIDSQIGIPTPIFGAILADKYVLVDKELLLNMHQQYSLYFVEPEDDKEYQEYTDPLEVSNDDT
jgi:hypothetical protein